MIMIIIIIIIIIIKQTYLLLASIPGLKGLLCYQKGERKDIAVHWDKAIEKGPGTKLGCMNSSL